MRIGHGWPFLMNTRISLNEVTLGSPRVASWAPPIRWPTKTANTPERGYLATTRASLGLDSEGDPGAPHYWGGTWSIASPKIHPTPDCYPWDRPCLTSVYTQKGQQVEQFRCFLYLYQPPPIPFNLIFDSPPSPNWENFLVSMVFSPVAAVFLLPLPVTSRLNFFPRVWKLNFFIIYFY